MHDHLQKGSKPEAVEGLETRLVFCGQEDRSIIQHTANTQQSTSITCYTSTNGPFNNTQLSCIHLIICGLPRHPLNIPYLGWKTQATARSCVGELPSFLSCAWCQELPRIVMGESDVGELQTSKPGNGNANPSPQHILNHAFLFKT